MVKVNSIQHLKELLNEENSIDFFINLTHGIKSSKNIMLVGNKFDICNEIDDTYQTLIEKELMDETITNIGRSIKSGNFYKY